MRELRAPLPVEDDWEAASPRQQSNDLQSSSNRRKNMQALTSKRYFRLLASIGILIVPLLGFGTTARGLTFKPGTGVISDDASNKVRSDGGGTYFNIQDCAGVDHIPSGWYQIRTIRADMVCQSHLSWWNFYSPYFYPPPAFPSNSGILYHRYFTLDFSSPADTASSTTPADLDGDGFLNNPEYAPARFVFSKAFTKKATRTPAIIQVFHVNSDGSTNFNFDAEITYIKQATITKVSGNKFARTISLSGTDAIADLSVGGVKVGTYYLPFSVLATINP
jgi:hypothetical protein